MSILDFDYKLNLKFSSPVTNHRFVLRCLPLCDETQRTGGVNVDIAPYSTLWRSSSPAEKSTVMGDVKFAHSEFDAHISGKVWTRHGAESPEPHPMYGNFTAMTQPSAKIVDIAKPFLRMKKTPLLFEEIMHTVYATLIYSPDSTNADTTAAEAAELGKGVCQDYAHIFCCVMRILGIPTRYVAGLGRIKGETHAWNECYKDGRWYAFDCTHDTADTDGYVKFTEGIDARQCALNRGVFASVDGSAVRQTQTVYAEVCFIE